MSGPSRADPAQPGSEQASPTPPSRDLDSCPRCGTYLDEIIWGRSDCPCCGLHFECC